MLGCYRKTDLIDPEIYGSAVVSVFMRYSNDVVAAVTEPATGLPSRLKWLPTIAEIVESCDAQHPAPAVSYWRPPPSVKRAPEAERLAHVARLRAEGKLTLGG